MYRSRLGGSDPGSKILKYLSSVESDSAIIRHDIVGSQAHVLMLLKIGLIKHETAKKILLALRSLGKRSGAGLQAGPTEDIHELVESVIIKKTGMDYGGRMHTARSRNDQVALDTRMKVREDINAICGQLLDTAEIMVRLACEHQRTIIPLYTHMQQGQVGLLSHWFLAHADAILRDFERLHDAFERVNKSPLGAGPVGGTSIPIDRDYVAELLGFDGLVENSLDATGTRDFAVEYVSMVSIMMSNLSRLSEDLVLWLTSEFSFVELADDLASSSSAMPQKKNPDVLELTRAKASEVAGGLVAMLGIVTGLASGYGRDLQQIKPIIWSSSETALSALPAIQSILEGLRINKRKMRSAATSSDLVALDLAERLVSDHDIPFRRAHAIAGTLVRHARMGNKPVRRLDLSEVKTAVGSGTMSPELLYELVSDSTVVKSLQRRISKGSSGYKEQRRMIDERRILINNYRKDLADRTKKIDDALGAMEEQIRSIT